jgi:DNA-binding XRE family transcriptional regulator|tara:strand:- start:172 stop:351 length:180 start_codon:yes stop_codon:yes gene_type:complete
MVSKMKLKRIEADKTQIDLWNETGIPQWRISLIERGMPPKAVEAGKIADALEATIEELF